MRKIIAITQVTLDGIMQAPGGPDEDSSGGFSQGGWAMPFVDESVNETMDEIMSGRFDLLLGRRTYDIFAGYWPFAGENVIAKAFNRATKFVVTRTSDRLGWENSQPIRGDAADGVRRLKASDEPELHVWGSGALLQTLIAADLVDEFRIWVFPLILGQGKRLFEKGVPPRGLTLVKSYTVPSGVVLNTYRSTGTPPRRLPHPENLAEAELARRGKRGGTDSETGPKRT
jgi:dihydrofolate reductase